MPLSFMEERRHAGRRGRSSRLLTTALFLAGTACILYLMAPQTVGETARRHLVRKLGEHYPQHSVTIRRGQFDPQIGLIFEDIRVFAATSLLKRAREMVRIERLTLHSNVRPEKLLDQQLPLETQRIVVEGITATTWLEPDGQFSLARLLPLPKFGPVVPRIEINAAKLRLIDPQSRDRGLAAEIAAAVIEHPAPMDDQVAQSITIRGAADFANDFLIQLVRRQDVMDVRGTIKGVTLTPSVYRQLPRRWAERFADAKDLQCACDAQFALRQDPSGQLNYKAKATVHEGRFDHDRLPKPLTDLRGILEFDPDGVTINGSHAVFGDAIVRGEGRIDGFAWPCDVDLSVSARGLMLDDRLAGSLPESVRAGWNKFDPHGQVDIVDATLKHANNQWSVGASVLCKGVSVRYEKFPYPIESLVGKIAIEDGIAVSDQLSGRIGDSRLQCRFHAPIRPELTHDRFFAVATDGPVTIDNSLLNALSPRGAKTSNLESFVRSLRPRGTIQLASAVFRTDVNGRITRNVDLRVLDGHVIYEKFQYPIDNIVGKILVDDELLTVEQLRASNANSGTVSCSGTFQMPAKPPTTTGYRLSDVPADPPPPSELQLKFVAENVPMDDSLRGALPESTRQAWDAISPSGVLDELAIDLSQHGPGTPVKLNFVATQHDDAQVTNKTLSLRPIALPYRLDVAGGQATFDGSTVLIRSLKGQHEASTLSADGQCVRNGDGRWELSLDMHSGSRLHPDTELIAAMPAQVREAMRRLQLRGPVSVRGKTRILLPDATNPSPEIAWNLGLQLEGNRIGDVGPVHALRGEIAVRGVQDRHGPRAVGKVRIDSMHVNDLQVTSIDGPFSVSGDRLFLGSQSRDRFERTSEPEHNSRSIEGKLFDGHISLDGQCTLSTGDFAVGVAMSQGKIPTLLAEFGHGYNELSGTFQGQARLQGTLGNADLLTGNGTARLAGANLYQLPLIVQFMNLLRVTPTEDVAFTDGQVEFAIDGRTVTFNDLQLWGDLVALHGGGTLDRLRDLDLTFNTRVSPQNTFSQLVRPLRSERYTLWTVDVHGPWHDLKIERRALEGVGETLERLFPAMAEASQHRQPDKQRTWGGWFP